MVAINNSDATGIQSVLLENKQQSQPKSNELGQDAFMRLMITQMENQDPLDPQTNADFIAQLAQFSSVEGLDRLNSTVESLSNGFQSNQALQASALVGRTVKVPTDETYLAEEGAIAGTIDLENSTSSMRLNIYDSNDQLVWNQDMGPQKAGDFDFIWPGVNNSDEPLPAGMYRFEAIAYEDGEPMQQDMTLSAHVNSVTLGNDNSITLNVAGVGPIDVSKVTEIY